jgi:UDP-N-acetylmuramyl pentapeptide phosphotransferase/UDP-N-acetylglucosamine-1-phosphate transferase
MTAIVAAVALSQIAASADYTIMVNLAMMMAAVIFGFFLLNYPLGLIFLGDAGAYTIGFVLSWFGISVLLNSPDVSPWAILLTVYWPIADTLLAIFRRSRSKSFVSAPDRLHVHQMAMRALEICVLGRNRRHIANPLTTLVLAPFVIAPPVAGVLLWNQNLNAFLAVLGFSVLFFASYAAVPVLIRRCRR